MSDRKLYIACESAIGKAAARELNQTPDQDACNMARTAIHLREQIFDLQQGFSGEFPTNVQEESVPPVLLSFIGMLLCGPSVKDSSNREVDDRKSVALAIAQLLIYNAVKKKPTKSVTNIRHRVERETPLPVYVALKVYAATEHSEETINKLHELRVCVSYARVRDISRIMGNSVVKMFEAEGAPCGPTLRKGLVTIGSADNIDVNPTNRDAKDALHGTGCALTQLPTATSTGTVRSAELYRDAALGLSSIAQLPGFYTSIKEVQVSTESVPLPAVTGPCRPPAHVSMSSPPALSQTSDSTESMLLTANNLLPSGGATPSSSVEERWVTHAQSIFEKDNFSQGDTVSWAAFCASNQSLMDRLPCITSMLPIFRNKASTSPMIYHAMSVIQRATEKLNPGQTPVITLDQPLYAIAKGIQWDQNTEFNEDNYLVFLGPLHSEMLLLKLLGDWLRDSGWIAILIDAEVTTPGRAEAMLKGSHVTRTRYTHQVTALSLSILRREAYTKYTCECQENADEPLPFIEWCAKMGGTLPQFKYWQTVYDMEMLLLRFVRSIRVGDFDLYVRTLDEVADWAFILDHYNYSRWLPVHVRDMLNLEYKHPDLYKQFDDGFFTVAKTNNPFSLIGFDHNHEQLNKELKMHRGNLNLGDECVFTEWSVAGPEVARVIAEFEAGMTSSKRSIPKHHDQSASVQNRFAADTKALVTAFQEVRNPFEEDSDEITILDTKEVMSDEVARSVMCAHEEGKKQHSAFVKERLESQAVSLHEPIKKNNLSSQQ